MRSRRTVEPWVVGVAAVPLRIRRCRKRASVEPAPRATMRLAATVITTSAPVASRTSWNEPPGLCAAWAVTALPVKLSGTAIPASANPSVSISGERLWPAAMVTGIAPTPFALTWTSWPIAFLACLHRGGDVCVPARALEHLGGPSIAASESAAGLLRLGEAQPVRRLHPVGLPATRAPDLSQPPPPLLL